MTPFPVTRPTQCVRKLAAGLLLSFLSFAVSCAKGGNPQPPQPPPVAPPVISSFTASPLIIGPGAKTTLVATFSGGTGVVDQQVGPVTSSVGKSTDSLDHSVTYTLTVTNTSGASVQATATVHVGFLAEFAGVPSPQGYQDGPALTARFYGPSGVVADASGNVYVADSGNAVIRLVSSSGTVSTIAGAAGQMGSADGVGAAARFVQPVAIAMDTAGNLYVADNPAIRKISSGGVVSTLAGGNYGSADGTGSAAQFQSPTGIAVDLTGNVYVADTVNHTIRKITAGGVVTTLAGSPGQPGSTDGLGSAARFNLPKGITVDPAGTVYVADTYNSTIRKITPAGLVSTFAGSPGNPGFADGSGSAARFSNPGGLALDSAGNIYVGDSQNNVIRKISPAGGVSTLAGNPMQAGSADGAGTAAEFLRPWGVTVDPNGLVYVDDGNNTIRKVTSAGVVTTVAGTAIPRGYKDGQGTTALFSYPSAAVVDQSGNIFVSDTGNHVIRKITPDGNVSTYFNVRFNSAYGLDIDTAGNLYVADAAENTITKVAVDGTVSTIAGSPYIQGSADGVGSAALFNSPMSVAVGPDGTLYVVDYGNSTIRKISPSGAVTTLAGSPGKVGLDDGIGSAALFMSPRGIAVDGSGNVYVADGGSHRIRKITSEGTVTTFAGSVIGGFRDGSGNVALFTQPSGLSMDSVGNLLVTDYWNHAIRMVTPNGDVSTVAGNPNQPENIMGPLPASIRFPISVAVNKKTEELYVVVENAVVKIGYQ